MTNWDAIVFTVQVFVIVSLIVGACVFVRALMYEFEDRRRRRARGGMLPLRHTPERPLAPIASLEMHRRYRANSDRRPAA